MQAAVRGKAARAEQVKREKSAELIAAAARGRAQRRGSVPAPKKRGAAAAPRLSAMKALDKFSSGPGGRRRSDGRKGADHVHAQRSRQAHPRRRAVQIGAKGGMAAASDAAQKKIYGAVSGFAQR